MLKQVTLTPERVDEIADAVKQARVCVLGDVCLDMYWHADMKRSRLSRETPHFPLPVVEEKYSPGGGGNVMNNVQALGVKKLLPISVIGDDWRGFLLAKSFEENHMDTSYLFKSQQNITPCYCKPMRMGISDVIYEDPRLDFENFDPLSEEEENKILELLETAAKEADIIAVSDQYRCGVVTERVREKLVELSARGIPVVVDSREKVNEYTGVIIKPNEVEAAFAIGRDIRGQEMSDEEYADIAVELQKKTGQPVIVTLGERGAIWCDENGPCLAPTVKAEPPVDIVGAGDTFLSAFCCAMAAGASGGEALAFANLASGVTVKKIGTTGTATTEEILQKYRENHK